MAEEIAVGFILEPPGAVTCDCGDLVGYIQIPDEAEPLAIVHPCHCEKNPDELEALMLRNHPSMNFKKDEE